MREVVGYRAVGLAAGLILAALLVAQFLTLLAVALLTVIISLPLAAAADHAQRRGLPRALGAVAALVLTIALVTGIVLLVTPAFVDQAKQFSARLPSAITSTEHYVHSLTGTSTKTLSADITSFTQHYTQHPQRLLGPLATIGLSLAAVVGAVIVVLVCALYIAIDPNTPRFALLALLPADRREPAARIMRRTRIAWIGWLTAIGIDMILLGSLLYAGMKVVGLDFALGFAIFSALLTVIPNYGSIISAIPPILLGLSQSPGKALLVLGVYVLVNQIEGNLILPLVMARTIDMHPALVAIGVLVVAQLLGIIGVLIGIPVISLALILVDELWVAPQEGRAPGGLAHPGELADPV